MENIEQDNEQVIIKLNKDLKKVAEAMDRREARFLVDSYYQSQQKRLRAEGQGRSMNKTKEPHAVLDWLANNSEALEKQVTAALGCFATTAEIGKWADQVWGIGPILNAGLQAYIDITKAETAGAIWNLMGFNPDMRWLGTDGADALVKDIVNGDKWNPGTHVPLLAAAAHMKADTLIRMATSHGAKLTKENVRNAMARRPWNANLKTLGYKIGESFVKLSNTTPESLYGRLFKERRTYEIQRNVKGENVQLAKDILASDKMKRLGKDTDCRAWLEGCFAPTGTAIATRYVAVEGKKGTKSVHFKNGVKFVPADDETVAAGFLYRNVGTGKGGIPMLPPSQIHARARRWVVKIFISHWHQAAYRIHFHKDPPNPFAIAHKGHAHFIEPEVPFPAI